MSSSASSPTTGFMLPTASVRPPLIQLHMELTDAESVETGLHAAVEPSL